MATTSDQIIYEYGTPDGNQPLNAGIAANVQLYRGTVALLSAGTAGGTKGYLKNADSPSPNDLVLGMLSKYGPGTADTIPGLLGGSTDGATSAEILTGSFLMASGTGSDQLSVTTGGQPVYLINATTVGATNGGSTRPLAGIQLPAGDLANLPVGSGGLYPIKLGTPNSPLGGP
jgi:hypothetical protein